MNQHSRPSRRPPASPLQNPLLRVLFAALVILLIVVLCVAATSLMPQIDPAALEPSAAPGVGANHHAYASGLCALRRAVWLRRGKPDYRNPNAGADA